MIRIGILGFGSMGRTHAYCVENMKYFYSNLPFDARVCGVYTPRWEKTSAIAKTFGIPFAAKNEEELIHSPNIDVIDICTPNVFHYETLKKAILAGKHIYCEKPLCITAAQAIEISELADTRKIIGQVVFNNRFLAPIIKMKELLDGNKLGKLYSFRSEYRHASCVNPKKPAGWKQVREICGGGVLFDLGSHAIDLLTFLCGKFKEKNGAPCITGRSQIAHPIRAGLDGSPWQTDADEAFYAIGELENGAVGTIEANKLATGENDGLKIELYGEYGALKFDLMDLNYLYYYDNSHPVITDDLGASRGFTAIECVGRYPAPGGVFPGRKAPAGWLRGHLGSMYAFLSSVYSGIPATPSFREAAYIQQVMEHLYTNDFSCFHK